MANKEALRALQSRLAERMLAARSQPAAKAWLAVECGGHGLLFPLDQAGEIFPLGTVLPVPHTQAWFIGVVNLRGGLHGVVDLAAFLGLRGDSLGLREQAHLVALNPALGLNCALLVDRLAGLRSAEQLTPLAPAAQAALPEFAGECRRDDDGRVWQEIRLNALANNEQFLGIVG